MLRYSKRISCAISLAFWLANSSVAQQPTPTPALPQPPITTGQADQAGATLQRMVVTGYVVPRIGVGPQPVVTLDQDFIDRQGDQTVSEVLLRIPQNVGSFTPAVNAGASFSPGASAVNLRGLGVNSTLVLIDGHRQVPFRFRKTEPKVSLT